jgi:glycosyltransferase involved in cell wall biosynthesis
MPRVSIILPNYNYGRYLDERIVSLLNQTYPDFELLILDDASTDHSAEVIKKYRHDPRVRAHFCQHNSGRVYQRWNEGAAMTEGEYLLVAGADDSCHPTMLEKLVSGMNLSPDIGLAFCHSWVMTAEGKIDYSTKGWAIDNRADYWLVDHIAPGREACRRLLLGNEVIPNASAVLIRRAAFDQAGGFDLSLPLAADYLLWGKIMLRWDVAFVAEILNYWRYHKDAVTSRAQKNPRDAAEIEELYRVVLFLVNELGGAQNREVAAEAMARRWVERLVEIRLRIPLWRNRSIYRVARQLDPKLLRRLTRLGWDQVRRLLRGHRRTVARVQSTPGS